MIYRTLESCGPWPIIPYSTPESEAEHRAYHQEYMQRARWLPSRARNHAPPISVTTLKDPNIEVREGCAGNGGLRPRDRFPIPGSWTALSGDRGSPGAAGSCAARHRHGASLMGPRPVAPVPHREGILALIVRCSTDVARQQAHVP